MKSLFTLLLVTLVLSGCANLTNNTQLTIGGEAGPIDITVAIDNNGQISVSGGIAPRFKVGLGPVSLKFGIQETLKLTEEKPFTLFVIWEDESGEIQREEYEIGKAFNVKFTQGELIDEIQGDNNCVIIAIKRPKIGAVTSKSQSIKSKTATRAPTQSNEISSEQFIRDYFRKINDHQYEITWSMLSKKFQANHTFSEYSSFWDSVDNLEIISINVKSENKSQAYVYVEANYHYKKGYTAKGLTTYKLIKSGNSWLFDPN